MIFYIPSDVTVGLTKFINLLTYHNTNSFINMKELVNYLGVILMLIGVAVFVYYHFAVIGGAVNQSSHIVIIFTICKDRENDKRLKTKG